MIGASYQAIIAISIWGILIVKRNSWENVVGIVIRRVLTSKILKFDSTSESNKLNSLNFVLKTLKSDILSI